MTIGIVLLVIAFVELLIGLMLIFRYQKSQATIFYGLFCVGGSLYVGSVALGFIGTIISGDLAEHLSWSGGIIISTFLLAFSFSFPLPRRSFREIYPWLLWPIVILIPGILFTEIFVKKQEIVNFAEGYTVAAGPYYWFLVLVFGGYMVWAFWNLIRSYSASTGYYRWMLRLLIAGLISSFIISSIFDIILQLITPHPFGFLGSFFTASWVIITGYIMLKK
ncbi:MAG: histidine kinase N-terminal 7TM domain-containing protein [bacterium]